MQAGGGGSLTGGNHELWEEQVPTPRRRDAESSNTNSPPLRKERALFGPLSDLQDPRPVRHPQLSKRCDPTLVQPDSHRQTQGGSDREGKLN